MCDVCLGINSHLCPVCGDQLDKVYCPECRGLGYRKCYAVSVKTGKDIEVTAETYMCLPADEYSARAAGRNYYRSDAEECEFCGGTGEVWLDQRGDYHKVI
jgi:hypothetical protein